MRQETQNLLESACPAALGNRPDDRVSDKYAFVPTDKVVSLLESQGWYLEKARQVKSRKWNPDTAKHHLTFAHERLSRADLAVGDSTPRLELINAHNGLGTYKLMAGIFRLVCGNGLIISERDFGSVKLRHIGFTEEDVIKASQAVVNNVSKLSDIVGEWQDIDLNKDQINTFAQDAAAIRWEGDLASEMSTNIIRPRRVQDRGSDLWTVYNVAQENLMRGGFSNVNTNRKARAIKNIDKMVSYNQQLWDLARAQAVSCN
jgi:phage terminase Nu1 subunit (DNA packaging protein)